MPPNDEEQIEVVVAEPDMAAVLLNAQESPGSCVESNIIVEEVVVPPELTTPTTKSKKRSMKSQNGNYEAYWP